MVEYELVNPKPLSMPSLYYNSYIIQLESTRHSWQIIKKIYVYALMGMHIYAIIYDMEQWIVQ